ncbi:MAG: hypothetical protein WC340_10380 [Kiritimatiellia bacterium]
MFERKKRSPYQQRAALPITPPEDAENGEMVWTLTTEAPTRVYDWGLDEIVEEVLLADGMQAPASGLVPLLDSHSQWSVDDILGHVDGFAQSMAGDFPAVTGIVHFCSDEKSQRTETKVKERHLTDGSVGYVVTKSLFIPDGETAAVSGRTFEGPIRVSYEWHLKEFSLTPIGADSLAKVSAA